MNSEAHVSGNLRKMQTQLRDVAHYTLVLDGVPIDMVEQIVYLARTQGLRNFNVMRLDSPTASTAAFSSGSSRVPT